MSRVSLARARALAVVAGGTRPRSAMCVRAHVRKRKGLPPMTVEVVASTSRRATDGLVIRESVWPVNIERIQRGEQRVPRVLAGHVSSYETGAQPVIGKIPLESIRLEPGTGLIHHITFAGSDVHAEGERYFNAFDQGFLTDVSIAWDDEVIAPEHTWERADTPEIAGLVWRETSAVAFGADPGAIKRARFAGAHDVAALLAKHVRHDRDTARALLGDLRAAPKSKIDQQLDAMERVTATLNPGDTLRRQLAQLRAATARLDALHLDDLARAVREIR